MICGNPHSVHLLVNLGMSSQPGENEWLCDSIFRLEGKAKLRLVKGLTRPTYIHPLLPFLVYGATCA